MTTLKKKLSESEIVKTSEKIEKKDGCFYFYDFRKNIYGGAMNPNIQKMFLEGDGNELVSKACALHSSSMLGYNFFHWIDNNKPLVIKWDDSDNEICYTKVSFEQKYTVLKDTKKSNMDIVLESDRGDYLFIESKFLEYTSNQKFEISETYFKDDRYITKNKDGWKELINEYQKHGKGGQYWGGIKQAICHLIALTNWLQENTVMKGDIRFINLVFDPRRDFDERVAFDRYKELYSVFNERVKGLIPDELKIGFSTYSKMWPHIKKAVHSDLEEYLYDRYIQFSDYPDKMR